MTTHPDFISQRISDLAHRFGLLAVPARLHLVNLLIEKGEMSVGNLVQESGLQQANVSKHLFRLAKEGLVSRRRDGKFVYYVIRDPALSEVCSLMCASLPGLARTHRRAKPRASR